MGGSSSGGSTNVGAIVGGVLGGVTFIIARVILLWLFRVVFRRRQEPEENENVGDSKPCVYCF
jgi:membrane protein implicated in regulation of membrane protease activity